MVLIRRNESNGGKYVKAARAGLTALVFFLLIPEKGLSQTKISQQSQSEKPEPKPQAPRVTTIINPAATKYEPHCDSPATKEDADYCQEWSATEAAEEQAKIAFYQLFASIIGIGAVAGTLYLTFKATRAAVDSAAASERSAAAAESAVVAMKEIDKRQGEDVKESIAQSARAATAMEASVAVNEASLKISRDGLIAEYRPWISFNGKLDKAGFSSGIGFVLSGQIFNHGRSPAINVVLSHKLYVGLPDTKIAKEYCASIISLQKQNRLREGEMIFPNQSWYLDKYHVWVPQDEVDADPVLPKTTGFVHLALVICITYKGPGSDIIYHTPYLFMVCRLSDDGHVIQYEIDPPPGRPQTIGLARGIGNPAPT